MHVKDVRPSLGSLLVALSLACGLLVLMLAEAGADADSLVIEKNTSAPTTHPIDPTGTFEFLVVCTGPDGVTSDTIFIDADTLTGAGTATGSITYADLDTLAPGTACTITEDTSGGGGGMPAGGALVSDNCQDGENNAPFNLQIRNTTNNPTNWEMVWSGRPYATIPNLSTGPYTHTVTDNGDGTYDHTFTGTTPLNGFQNVQITGGLPNPAGTDFGCGSVERFIIDDTPTTTTTTPPAPTSVEVLSLIHI